MTFLRPDHRRLRGRVQLLAVGLVVVGLTGGFLAPAATSKGPPQRTLTVTLAGTGSGTVTSSPAGIDCGATCTAQFKKRTLVTLTASPAAGSTFDGWSGGGCSGTGDCTFRLTDSASVTATFTQITYTLSVSLSPSGGGTVTGTGGIDCPTVCASTIDAGTPVTLSATANSGYVFWHWSGDCAGSSCSLTMDGNKSVEADYAEGTALCGTDPQVKHSNGLGQYWFDCTPLGTPGNASAYTVTMATEAAAAWSVTATVSYGTCTGSGTSIVVATDTANGKAAAWAYTGTTAGYVRLNPTGTTVSCPGTFDLTWG